MTKRISYIDNTRAILIALVVLGHILNYANPKYDIVPYVLVQQFLDSAYTSRELLVSLIERVELTEDKQIIIKFRFAQLDERLESQTPQGIAPPETA